MGKTVNRRRVMYAVTFSEHEVETPLEVLEAFIDWTHKNILRVISQLQRCCMSQTMKQRDCWI